MNTNDHNIHPKQQKSDLKNVVLARIRNEKVCPKSKWTFLCINCSVWLLWIATIVIGAVAVSELIYLSLHSGFELFDITHGAITPFVLESLPYVWLVTFALMVLIAYYDMRQTRRGYRYPFSWIVGSSLMFTVAGGVALNAAGVSSELDRTMSTIIPGYVSAQEWQEYLWLHPEDGRITGSFVAMEPGTQRARFTDAVGREWQLAIYELAPRHRELLFSGDRVRLLGEVMPAVDGDGMQLFYTCGVMTWMPEEGHTIETLRASRAEAKALLTLYSPVEGGSADSTARSPLRCREIVRHVFHKNY